MGVKVVSAHSAAELLTLLGNRVAAPREDPFTPDLVVVPGQGMIDWLQESLPTCLGDTGIVANVHFWHPNEFNVNVRSYSVGLDNRWRVEQLQWTILEVLTVELQRGAEFAPGFGSSQNKAGFALRVAELFDRYSVQRPEMIRAWAGGDNTDGRRPLEPRHLWQPALWRTVRDAVGRVPHTVAGAVVDRHPLVDAAQITFFGLEAFSRSKVEVLRALGDTRDILVLNVTPVHGLVTAFRSSERTLDTFRRQNDISEWVKNPLLVSWARPAVESAALLATVAGEVEFSPRPRGETVLSALQGLLATDRSMRPRDAAALLTQSDGTVQIHRCHGTTRQVEVLRDALLHLLKRDPTLTPRDVLVLCPDLDRFSPVIEPLMSSKIGPDGRHLRVAIVDRSASTAAPFAIAIDSVLSLMEGRCAALDVIEVLSLDPVRTRFGFDEDELARVVAWVTALNVQWGLDPSHREEWGYPTEAESGTWAWAMDRLVAGVLLQSPDVIEDTPGLSAFDDISGSDISIVGKLDRFHKELLDLRAHVATRPITCSMSGISSRTFTTLRRRHPTHG